MTTEQRWKLEVEFWEANFYTLYKILRIIRRQSSTNRYIKIRQAIFWKKCFHPTRTQEAMRKSTKLKNKISRGISTVLTSKIYRIVSVGIEGPEDMFRELARVSVREEITVYLFKFFHTKFTGRAILEESPVPLLR